MWTSQEPAWVPLHTMPTSESSLPPPLARPCLQDHDAVFWFGDLNYRIESAIPAVEVLRHAVSQRLPFLAANDQLNWAREAGDAFEGFHEGEAAEGWVSRLGGVQ